MFVSSEEIALVASKKKIDVKREEELIKKSKTSKCRCHHLKMVGQMCMYRTCRHTYDTHNKVNLV